MSCQNIQDFCVGKGATLHPVIRWATDTLTSVPITGISQAAPAVVTAVAHAMPDGWQCAVVSAQGLTGLNATRYPPRGADWHKGTVLTANTVQLNDVSSADLPAYTSGGFLVYQQPADLTSVTVTMTIWDNPDHSGTPLVTLTNGSGITLDNTNKTIGILLQTAALTWTVGYYQLKAQDGGGIVTELAEGTITIE